MSRGGELARRHARLARDSGRAHYVEEALKVFERLFDPPTYCGDLTKPRFKGWPVSAMLKKLQKCAAWR